MNNTEAGIILTDNKVTATGYRKLKIENELLKAQATVNEIAMAQMSREICELNNQLQDILDQVVQLREMQ